MALNNGLVNRDQLGAVWKGGLDLNIGNHVGNAIHHVGAGEQAAAFAHELGYGFTVARTFHDRCADKGNRFGVVELKASGFSSFGQEPGSEYQKFVFFAWGEFHGALW